MLVLVSMALPSNRPKRIFVDERRKLPCNIRKSYIVNETLTYFLKKPIFRPINVHDGAEVGKRIELLIMKTRGVHGLDGIFRHIIMGTGCLIQGIELTGGQQERRREQGRQTRSR